MHRWFEMAGDCLMSTKFREVSAFRRVIRHSLKKLIFAKTVLWVSRSIDSSPVFKSASYIHVLVCNLALAMWHGRYSRLISNRKKYVNTIGSFIIPLYSKRNLERTKGIFHQTGNYSMYKLLKQTSKLRIWTLHKVKTVFGGGTSEKQLPQYTFGLWFYFKNNLMKMC